MQITLQRLENANACNDGKEWVIEHKLIGLETPDFVKKLMAAKKYFWADWLLCYVVLTLPQLKKYICFKMDMLIEYISICT